MIWKYIRNLIFGNPKPDAPQRINGWPATTERIIDPWRRPIRNTPRTINNTPRPIINTPRPIQTRPALPPVVVDDEEDSGSSLLNTVIAAEVISDLLTPTQTVPVFQGYGGGDSGGGASSNLQDDPVVEAAPFETQAYEAPADDPAPVDDPFAIFRRLILLLTDRENRGSLHIVSGW